MNGPPIRRSNPPSIRVEDTRLYRDMHTLREQFTLIRDQGFTSIGVQGLPGLGKTYTAETVFKVGKMRLISVRPHAPNLMDVLHKYRDERFVLLWDDTNYVFDSAPILNLLNIAVDPRGVRMIPDNRKGGHGNFIIRNHHAFITNKPLLTDIDLTSFDKNMRAMIAPLKSRFHLKMAVSEDMLEAFHYSCWLATDGAQMLKNLRSKDGRTLSLAACNELLDWFAQHFAHLDEVSPRTLLTLAEYRLKAPDIWESLSQHVLLPEPRTEAVLINGKLTARPLSIPPAWTIRVVPAEHRAVAVKGITLPDEPVPVIPASLSSDFKDELLFQPMPEPEVEKKARKPRRKATTGKTKSDGETTDYEP